MNIEKYISKDKKVIIIYHDSSFRNARQMFGIIEDILKENNQEIKVCKRADEFALDYGNTLLLCLPNNDRLKHYREILNK